MKPQGSVLVLILVFLQPISTLASSRVETSSRFVERVFAEYRNPDQAHLGQRQNKFYTPELARLIRADRNAHPGEICDLDFDPICDCQDPGNPGELEITSIHLAPSGVGRAKARVSFTIAGQPRAVTLILVQTKGSWRIDDISTAHTPSLRRLLAERC